jgi:hypothetical protein
VNPSASISPLVQLSKLALHFILSFDLWYMLSDHSPL